jgi:drug/metabolite transporter (DMT)-like permease
MIWALASAAGAALMVVPWKLANEAGDPAHSVLVLLTVAALGSSTLGLGQRIRDEARPLRMGRMELGVASVLAIFTLLGNFASARAIQDISPALLNVLLRADVIFVAIFGWALLGERVERTFWLGAAVAMAGLIVLQGPIADDGLWALLSSGTGMAVVAAACFSGLAVVTRRFIHRIDPVAVNAIRLWIAVGIWFLFNPIPDLSRIPHEQIIYSAMAAIAGPFLGRLALMISSRYLEARMTTLGWRNHDGRDRDSDPACTYHREFEAIERVRVGPAERSFGAASIRGAASIGNLAPRD